MLRCFFEHSRHVPAHSNGRPCLHPQGIEFAADARRKRASQSRADQPDGVADDHKLRRFAKRRRRDPIVRMRGQTQQAGGGLRDELVNERITGARKLAYGADFVQEVAFRRERRIRSEAHGNTGTKNISGKRAPQRKQIRTRAPDHAGADSPDQFPAVFTEAHRMNQYGALRQNTQIVQFEDLPRGGVVGSLAGMDQKRRARRSGVKALENVRLESQRVRPAITLRDANREIIIEGRVIRIVVPDRR